MRRAILIAVLATAAIVPATTVGNAGGSAHTAMLHPGGLDGRGGHHCWTRCRSWGRYYGEYHCHRSPCNRRDVRRHRRHGH
jgi:hypothetical protein